MGLTAKRKRRHQRRAGRAGAVDWLIPPIGGRWWAARACAARHAAASSSTLANSSADVDLVCCCSGSELFLLLLGKFGSGVSVSTSSGLLEQNGKGLAGRGGACLLTASAIAPSMRRPVHSLIVRRRPAAAGADIRGAGYRATSECAGPVPWFPAPAMVNRSLAAVFSQTASSGVCSACALMPGGLHVAGNG